MIHIFRSIITQETTGLLKLIYSANSLSSAGLNNKFWNVKKFWIDRVLIIVASSVDTQGRIQNLIKHLRWNVLRKRSAALNCSLFSLKFPFYMFGWEQNSHLTLVWATYWVIFRGLRGQQSNFECKIFWKFHYLKWP